MIVLTTPTGDIGSKVLAEILKSDEPIRVIVRDAAKLDDAIKNRVEVIEGSTDNKEVVTKAFENADAVFWVVPGDDNTDDLEAHYIRFNKVAAHAAKAQNVTRLVWVSTLGINLGETSGHLSAAKAGDVPLIETGIAARILDPATFMENYLRSVSSIKQQSVYYGVHTGDNVLHTVSTKDIAKNATELLLDHSWDGQEHVPLIGPDNLTPNQMAKVMSEVLGKPISYVQSDIEATRMRMMGFGMSEAAAGGLMDMAVAQSNGVYIAEAETAERAQTSFRTWCETVLKPAYDA